LESQIKYSYTKTSPKTRFNQGDILRDIEIITANDINIHTSEYAISKIHLSFGIVINQECDLEHDFDCRQTASDNQDKYLPNILLLPAYLPEDFKSGNHRGEISAAKWSEKEFTKIKQNSSFIRFHYIKQNLDFQIPELVVDFKHIYTLGVAIAYKQIDKLYLASISEMFRESLSNRYCHYLSRIGLPEIN
jgi:hypothetical protein